MHVRDRDFIIVVVQLLNSKPYPSPNVLGKVETYSSLKMEMDARFLAGRRTNYVKLITLKLSNF